MKNQREILKEISNTSNAIVDIKMTGGVEHDTEFLQGWMQALIWVITTTIEEGEA